MTSAMDEIVQKFIFEFNLLNDIKLTDHNIGVSDSSIGIRLAHQDLSELHLPQVGCEYIETLALIGCRLERMPDISSMPNLQKLDLAYNPALEIPEFPVHRVLQELQLRNNGITELPTSISRLENLRFLYLSNNLLVQLPESIAKLHLLQKIDLQHNQIREVPPGIRQMKRLTELDLSYNHLSELQSWMDNLPLEKLDLSYNDFLAIPDVLSSMKGLNELNVIGHTLNIYGPVGVDPLLLLRTLVPIDEKDLVVGDQVDIDAYRDQIKIETMFIHDEDEILPFAMYNRDMKQMNEGKELVDSSSINPVAYHIDESSLYTFFSEERPFDWCPNTGLARWEHTAGMRYLVVTWGEERIYQIGLMMVNMRINYSLPPSYVELFLDMKYLKSILGEHIDFFEGISEKEEDMRFIWSLPNLLQESPTNIFIGSQGEFYDRLITVDNDCRHLGFIEEYGKGSRVPNTHNVLDPLIGSYLGIVLLSCPRKVDQSGDDYYHFYSHYAHSELMKVAIELFNTMLWPIEVITSEQKELIADVIYVDFYEIKGPAAVQLEVPFIDGIDYAPLLEGVLDWHDKEITYLNK